MSFSDAISGAIEGGAASGGNPLAAALGGVLGLIGGSKQRKAEKQANARAAAAADPFASYRPQLADRLMSLYGIQKPFQYANQSELDQLQQRKDMATSVTPDSLLATLGPLAGHGSRTGAFSGARDAAIAKLRMQANLSPEEEQRLQQLQAEKAQQEQAYKNTPSDPTEALMQIPGLKAALDLGTKAAIRGASAQGRALSGNLLTELQQFGTNTAAQYYNQEVNRLSGLAGATGTAGAGAQYLAQTPQTPQYAGVGGLLATLPGFFSTMTKSSTSTPLSGEAQWWQDYSKAQAG